MTVKVPRHSRQSKSKDKGKSKEKDKGKALRIAPHQSPEGHRMVGLPPQNKKNERKA